MSINNLWSTRLYKILMLVLFLSTFLLAKDKNNYSIDNNTKSIIDKVVSSWLDILSSHDEIDMNMFSEMTEIDLLETENDKNLLERITQRKKEFNDGKYSINDIIVIKNDSKTIAFKVVLDWVKQDGGSISRARIEETIKLEYKDNIKKYLINSISEKYLLPSDGLAVKLKC